jgi:hypothetical protein
MMIFQGKSERVFCMEASTDLGKSQETEAEECYNAQKRLEEEELLARAPGEPGDEDGEINPSLLDISMEDVTNKASNGGAPNPIMGGTPNDAKKLQAQSGV